MRAQTCYNPLVQGRPGPSALNPWRIPMKRLRVLLLCLVLLALASPAAAYWPRAVLAEMGSATW